MLRNNRTTDEYPLGIFHPHQEKHHIKKENIGLIEVMGLAVLPARLNKEMAKLKDTLLAGKSVADDPEIASHAAWAADVLKRHPDFAEHPDAILQDEIGQVFSGVLEDAGVYKDTEEGRKAFRRFTESVQ